MCVHPCFKVFHTLQNFERKLDLDADLISREFFQHIMSMSGQRGPLVHRSEIGVDQIPSLTTELTSQWLRREVPPVLEL